MTCCVTGHRPQKFPFEYSSKCSKYVKYRELLYNTVEQLILEGYRYFISGMAQGVDLDFAETVVQLKDNVYICTYDIKLEAALPFTEHSHDWEEKFLIKHWFLLDYCDKVKIVSPNFHKGCFQKRNKYMVDNSDLVLAIWNGEERGGTWNTIKYARSKKKKIIYIMLNEIED